jgi:hypothetical protein
MNKDQFSRFTMVDWSLWHCEKNNRKSSATEIFNLTPESSKRMLLAVSPTLYKETS